MLLTAVAVLSAGQEVLTRTVEQGAGHLGDAEQDHQQGLQPAAGQRHGVGGVVCQDPQDCQYKVGFNLLI